jgi:P27 family predicted phage terminase small subunit
MPSDLEPPPMIQGETLRIWRATVAQLLAAGTTAKANPDALLAYVSAVATHQRATALLAQTDIIVQRDGKPVPNPALAVQRQAASTITRLSRQLGLNRTPPGVAVPMQGQNPSQEGPDRGRWCDEHRRWECTRGKKSGAGHCHSPSVLGYTACRMHVGKRVSDDPQHILAVEQAANPLRGQPLDIGPAEALLWRVRVLAGEVQRLDDLIGTLERDELVFGVTREETTETADGLLTRTITESRVNTWVLLRHQRETMLATACEAALRANIEERLVRLAEQQGAVIHRLLITVLVDFGISPDDARIPQIIPMRLRELSA